MVNPFNWKKVKNFCQKNFYFLNKNQHLVVNQAFQFSGFYSKKPVSKILIRSSTS